MIQAHADLIRRHRLRISRAVEASNRLARDAQPAIDGATERAITELGRIDGDGTEAEATIKAMSERAIADAKQHRFGRPLGADYINVL